MLADKGITKAELKVGTYLLMIKYNDHTGQCNPGNDVIAEATALDVRTVARAKVALRIAMYLVYESTEGGYKSDTTNDYEFRFPPLADTPGVKPAPKSTPGRNDTTPDRPTKGTPGRNDTGPLVGAPPKQYLEQPSLNKSISNVPLPSVADTLPCQSGSKVEKAKEERKRTSEEAREASKPTGIRFRYRIENGIAYVSVPDQDTRCRLLGHFDRMLDQIRSETLGVQVRTAKISVERPLNGSGGHA